MISFQSFDHDSSGEPVRIVCGPAHHSEYFAGARIERNNRAAAVFHRQFGDSLQIQVDGELQILARDRLLIADDLPLLAAVIDHHLPLPVDAHQLLVVLPLDSLLADDVALLVVDELGGIQFVFADFTHVADHVRGEAVLRIEPPLRVDQFHLREGAGIAVRFHKGQFAGGEFFFDDDRLVGRTFPEAASDASVRSS